MRRTALPSTSMAYTLGGHAENGGPVRSEYGMSKGGRTVNIVESKQGAVTVLSIEGRLDAVSAPALEGKITALAAAGTVRIVLDCAKLEYVSSAGLRVFLSAAKRLKGAQGRFALGGAVQQVREILDMAGFASVLPVLKTAEDAVAACAS